MTEFYTAQLDEQGRVALPAEVRDRLVLKAGDELTFELAEDGFRLRSRDEALRRHDEAIRRLQRLVREHVPPEVSLVDELIAERRAEAAREDAEG